MLTAGAMAERDQRMTEIIAEESGRLRGFLRRHAPDPSEVEDLLQEIFYELVEANRLLVPIEHLSGWLYRVARNRLTDLFRKKRPARFSELEREGAEGERLGLEELLPSPDAGPDAVFARRVLAEELEAALDELPAEQRAVFLAHEVEGRSFKELAAATGVNQNTLLARKRYAVQALRARLRTVYEEFVEGED